MNGDGKISLPHLLISCRMVKQGCILKWRYSLSNKSKNDELGAVTNSGLHMNTYAIMVYYAFLQELYGSLLCMKNM